MNIQEIYNLWNIVFGLEREVVGFKFLMTEEEFENEEAQEVKKDIRYCVLVKSAMTGKSIKVNSKNFKCEGSGSTFGYHEVPDSYFEGKDQGGIKLHKNEIISKSVRENMYFLDGDTYGVVVKPLNEFNDDAPPDVVLIVTDTYNAMRVSQGYTYEYGLKKDFNIAGNKAVCLEATVVPLVEGDINITMLCAGTRHAAKWTDNELMIGLAWDKVEPVLNGVIKTINTIEPDEKKKEIINRNGSKLIDKEEIIFGDAYFYRGSFL